MKKAQNLVEVSVLISLVAVVAITSLAIYNNQRMKLANLTNPNLKNVNVVKMSETSATAKIKVPSTAAETAGTSALTVMGMNSDKFKSEVSDITYEDLKEAAAAGGSDIFDLTNDLIAKLNLNYDKVSAENITPETVDTMIGVLNAASIVSSSDANKATADSFIKQFEELID